MKCFHLNFSKQSLKVKHAAFSLEFSKGARHISYCLQLSGEGGFAGKQRIGPQKEAQELGALPLLADDVPEEMWT